MRVKCYALYQAQQQIFAEYANPSQKSFLAYEISTVANRSKKSNKIETDQTQNGTWYYKTAQSSKSLHLILMEGPSLANANSILSKGVQWQQSKISQERLRMKIAQQMKIINANTKMDNINSNVMELEHMMKGNVSKIISNMSDLETAQRKSQRLNSLSMQLENDSRSLEEKMKRKACMRKLIMGGILGFIAVFLIYYFFL